VEELERLRQILMRWMAETGDNVPEDLTRDWYLKEPGYKHSPFHNIRGEMPGNKHNAIEINAGGPF
jgi:N-sulfoglucosamine sulfohydrolase